MAPRPADLLARVNGDVERSFLRARNGLRYVRGRHRPKLGVTPKDVVWRRDKAQLWRYRRDTPARYAQPLVIVTSLVSRSYILDLIPGSSSVEFLRDQGFDVFMVDWGIPDELDAGNTFETYVDEYLPRALDAVLRETGADEVTLVGYCLGAVLAFLHAAGHDAPVRNLVLLATPMDTSEMGPTTVVAQQATLLQNLWNDEFVKGFQAVAQWTRDQVPFPGAAFRQLVDDLVRGNALMQGRWRLGGREIDFTQTDAAVLNVMAAADRVVPRAASLPVGDLVGRPE